MSEETRIPEKQPPGTPEEPYSSPERIDVPEAPEPSPVSAGGDKPADELAKLQAQVSATIPETAVTPRLPEKPLPTRQDEAAEAVGAFGLELRGPAVQIAEEAVRNFFETKKEPK